MTFKLFKTEVSGHDNVHEMLECLVYGTMVQRARAQLSRSCHEIRNRNGPSQRLKLKESQRKKCVYKACTSPSFFCVFTQQRFALASMMSHVSPLLLLHSGFYFTISLHPTADRCPK